MKKSITVLFLCSCCLLLLFPVLSLAQTQFPYPPPATTYQTPSYQAPYQMPYQTPYQMPYQTPYQSPYAPSLQPCAPYSCSPSTIQPTQCWQGSWSSSTQMYRCGLSLVYAKRYNDAIGIFQQFLSYYPQSSLADNALYWTGEAYYAQKQYHTALAYFQRVLYGYPQGNKVPDATLKIALSYISMKQYSEGCRVLQDLMARYPNSESARKGCRWLAQCGGGYGNCYTYPTYPSQSPSYYGDMTSPKYW